MGRHRKYIAYSVCLDGVVKYIGITTTTLARRWSQHCCTKQNGALQRAIKKYGRSAFVIEQIASAWDASSLNDLEKILVDQHQTFGSNGYNMTAGGNQPIVFLPEVVVRMTAHFKNPSEKIRKNMSAGAKRRYSTAEGKAAASVAQQKRWTTEARAAQAERARKQYQVPGAREAQSERSMSWFATDAAKAANSVRVRARLAPPEARAAHGARISNALSAPSAKVKMSEGQKRRWSASRQTGE